MLPLGKKSICEVFGLMIFVPAPDKIMMDVASQQW